MTLVTRYTALLLASVSLASGCQTAPEPWYVYFGEPLEYVAADATKHTFGIRAEAKALKDHVEVYIDGQLWNAMTLTVLRPRATLEDDWLGNRLSVTCVAYETDSIKTVSICDFDIDGQTIGQIEANRIVVDGI